MPKQTCKILDGRKLADKILHNIHQQIVRENLSPSLAVILVGNDPASQIYVHLKKKACEKVGIDFYLYNIDKKVAEIDLIKTIRFLNRDPEINAILVQLPLPKHLDENKIIAAIDPRKDADGFHPDNLKLLAQGKPLIIPGLCEGIIKLIQQAISKKDSRHLRDLRNLSILIISNNKTFAQPFKHLLKNSHIRGLHSPRPQAGLWSRDAITWLSPKDKNLQGKSLLADIIVVAVGIPKFLKASMIKKNAIIIDVGCNRVAGKTTGDVDFASCSKKASHISPVPGGVGPVTVAMLLANVVKLSKLQK